MPNPTQCSLIHVLLLWTTILSITQVVFIVIFFTAGHHEMNKSSEVSRGPGQIVADKEPSTAPDNELHSGRRQMLTFKANRVNRTIKWITRHPDAGLVLESGNGLTILKDGYYFLSLQVTLTSCEKETSIVKLWKDSEVLLQGKINPNTCSTGFLGKIADLSAGWTLMVNVNNSNINIDDSESLTHLNIIYMP